MVQLHLTLTMTANLTTPVGSVWVRITEFPDYAVSGDGHVMRLTPCRGTRPGLLLKPGPNSNGYPTVVIRRAGVTKTHLVHRLVAAHFIPNPENRPEVNHRDGRKTNSSYDNLEWATGSENTLHAFAIGLRSMRGANNPNAKLDLSQVATIKRLRGQGHTPLQLARRFGVSRSAVYVILRGKTWK